MRLIDADVLRAEYQAILDRGDMFCEYDIIGMLDNAPTVEERPTGKWIPQTDFDGFTYWKCSECSKKNDFAITKFCWHCGADMRKEAENE